jgi:hypothetical protein
LGLEQESIFQRNLLEPLKPVGSVGCMQHMMASAMRQACLHTVLVGATSSAASRSWICTYMGALRGVTPGDWLAGIHTAMRLRHSMPYHTGHPPMHTERAFGAGWPFTDPPTPPTCQ